MGKKRRRQKKERPEPKQKTKKKRPPAPVKTVEPEIPDTPSGAPGLTRKHLLIVIGLLILAGGLAYFNSFQGVFLFDDRKSILENPNIRSLTPIWTAMTAPFHCSASGRPLVSLSLSVSYAISEYQVWGYHLVNLIIHLLAGLTLFGVIRRTLHTQPLREKFGQAATVLAGAISLIWLVHPLNTMSVTYVIQRAESLVGLFYLLCFYCTIRSHESPGLSRWQVLAMLCGFLASMTKEVSATLPIVLILYDRAFLGGSFRESLKLRKWLYIFLCCLWIVPVITTLSGARKASGFNLRISPLDYFKMQCNLLLRYLGLLFWPGSLIFDYGWPRADGFFQYAPAAGVLTILGVATLVALKRRPPIGFLGAWFFVILGPSSSFLVIISEIGAEHRMYLPSIAIIGGTVVAVYWLLHRFLNRKMATVLGVSAALVIVPILGVLTHFRNRDYHSLESIWGDTARKTPDNYRAHHHLALAHAKITGNLETAIQHFSRTIEIQPRHSEALTNRGITYGRMGQTDLALEDFNRSIQLDDQDYKAFLNRGITNARLRDFQSAVDDFDRSLELKPNQPSAYMFRGEAYGRLGYPKEAVEDLERSQRMSKNKPKRLKRIRNQLDRYRRMLNPD